MTHLAALVVWFGLWLLMREPRHMRVCTHCGWVGVTWVEVCPRCPYMTVLA